MVRLRVVAPGTTPDRSTSRSAARQGDAAELPVAFLDALAELLAARVLDELAKEQTDHDEDASTN